MLSLQLSPYSKVSRWSCYFCIDHVRRVYKIALLLHGTSGVPATWVAARLVLQSDWDCPMTSKYRPDSFFLEQVAVQDESRRLCQLFPAPSSEYAGKNSVDPTQDPTKHGVTVITWCIAILVLQPWVILCTLPTVCYACTKKSHIEIAKPVKHTLYATNTSLSCPRDLLSFLKEKQDLTWVMMMKSARQKKTIRSVLESRGSPSLIATLDAPPPK